MAGEKRRSQRRTYYKVCRYSIEGREYADLSTNISDKGIFIKSFSPPPVGTEVLLSVRSPDNQTIRIVGNVAHVNLDADPHKRGMGIEFKAVIAESADLIRRFVQEIFGAEPAPQSEIIKAAGKPGGSISYEYRIVAGKTEPPGNARRK